jgi:xylan 1,4-beta-xylosidase
MNFKNVLLTTLMLVMGTYLFAQTTKAKKNLPVSERIIRLDFNNPKGSFNQMFKECVGAGRANEGLRADWQRQLAYVKKECDFKYIRMHGLLTDDMAIYSEDKKGNPQYNYQYVDELFDFLLRIGIKPFVELGFMPNALASGPQTIFWWRGNVTPPKDYDKWAGMIGNLTQHFTERYGKEEVKTWYFEVWNEPNLSGFFSGTQAEYFKMYEYAVKAIKKVSADYRVGGPATAGAAWVPEMIAFCAKNNLPIDFVSTHTYGVKQGYLDEFGQSGTVLSKETNSITGDVFRTKKEIELSAKPTLEQHYTEWSSSYTPSDPMHDSYHQAAYILEKLKHVGNKAASMSYWVFTDIFEEAGPRFTPFHGGFGLINYQDINKPAFYAYQYLNKMGETELANADSSSWVCKDKSGNVQFLVWDFSNTHPGDSVWNQVYYKRDLPSKPKGKAKINLENMPKGKYVLEMFKTGYRANDVYTTYLDMGSPEQLTKAQVEQIKKINSGAPVSSVIVDVKEDKIFSKELEIRENDVFLITLTKI